MRGRYVLNAAVVMLAAAARPESADAQTWRTIELARQLRDTAPHTVSVTYGRGELRLFPADRPLLYDAQIRYDEERGIPSVEYDRATRRLEIDFEVHEESPPGRQRRFGEMRLGLSPAAPLDLALELGAVEAELDLGGLALTRLRVEAGASSSRVAFGSPNTVPMARLDLHAGAATITATQLANANAAEMRIAVSVGNVDLDFDGTWTRDIDATVDVALGRARIHVPSDVGVRVELSRVFARFEHPDFEEQGDAWVSSNWERARHKLILRMNTTFGTVQIDRIER